MTSSVKAATEARVLVVEDDAFSRSGIVVTDLKMPGMDGIALLHQLHEQDPDLPVIVATAAADLASAVLAMRAGAEDYVAKPIDLRCALALGDAGRMFDAAERFGLLAHWR